MFLRTALVISFRKLAYILKQKFSENLKKKWFFFFFGSFYCPIEFKPQEFSFYYYFLFLAYFFFTFAYGSFCFRKVLELEGKTCIASRVYPTVAAFIDPHLYAFNNGTETITVDKLNVWSTNKPVKMNSWKVMCNLKHNFIRSSDITEIFKSRLKKQKKKNTHKDNRSWINILKLQINIIFNSRYFYYHYYYY